MKLEGAVKLLFEVCLEIIIRAEGGGRMRDDDNGGVGCQFLRIDYWQDWFEMQVKGRVLYWIEHF